MLISVVRADPYMRTVEGMGDPEMVGRTMLGGTVCVVIESRCASWNVGDLVVSYYGWQEYVVASPADVQWRHKDIPIQRWLPETGPPSCALGVLGMTGYTAYFGLLEVGQPKPGETVVVSAASGAVGQVVGQISKALGCRVVGIAGGETKCKFCVEELGFDMCIDYKKDGFPAALSAATPSGIDVYFENVGGPVLEAVLPRLNSGCRVPICGFVSSYNDMGSQPTPMQRLAEFGIPKMSKTGSPHGFRFFFWNHPAFLPKLDDALATLSKWVQQGKLKYRESVTNGIDTMVDSFIGMLNGQNFGKTIVKMS